MIGNRLEVWLHHGCVIECLREDGLYSIDAVIPTVSQSLYVVGHHHRMDSLWHKRLGHVGTQAVIALSRNGLFSGMKLHPKASTSYMPICEACVMGNHDR
jgi:hypothetical protein